MVVVERSVLVEFSADEMRGLVQDVDSYPKFLPWCSGATVKTDADGDVMATIEINFRGIRQQFTTRNTAATDAPIQSVHMKLVVGPFKSLDGEWRFHALTPEASKVTLHLKYEFSSRILEKAIGPVFRHITDTLVEAFVQRARAMRMDKA